MFEEELEQAYYTDTDLTHYGMPRRSGRYPWGSGKESYQRTQDFLGRIEYFKSKGMTEKEVADAFGLKTTQFRAQMSLAKSERRADLVATAQGLREKGYSLNAIAKEMGFKNDSSVRSLLDERSAQKMDEAVNVADTLKKNIDKKGMIDVGTGVERELGTSKEKLEQALYILEMEGYPTYTGGMDQVTNAGKRTTIKVVCPPGTEHKEIYETSKINSLKDYNTMTGEAKVRTFEYPKGISLDRVSIRYAEEGGIDRDGTIELKRGVPDLNLGNSHYSQVRILVETSKDPTKQSYLKGMAVYKDDDNFPPGVDVVFNTNKAKGTPPEKVFKSVTDNLKKNPNNPFGSLIGPDGQSHYIDKDGKEQLSAINKRADEGDWAKWKNGLPSQFLSKQNTALIKKQLTLSKADKSQELEEIMSINNPTIRKHFLKSFADDCDSSAESMKAASLPRQRYQVILPEPTLKDNEIYAPNFKQGETVVLVRFPHGGTFEIPTVKVNNKNKEAEKTISKNAKDAVCINSRVAERLSGADFDGDTVLVIPMNPKYKINTQDPLPGLKDFNNKAEYPARPGMKVMQKSNVGREMGKISNLITDMTLKGATPEELCRAVKHSMVVIDACKHKLDYKKSYDDNNIGALREKYQTTVFEDGSTHTGGASTLLSRSKSKDRVDKIVGTPKINTPGKPWYDPKRPEGVEITFHKKEEYVDKNGKIKYRTSEVSKMKNTDDANTLVSSYKAPQELLYADYANSLKSLANQARKDLVITPRLSYSPNAKKKYQKEVDSLNAKLNTALLNAPRERQAQLLANSIVKEKKLSNPNLEKEELKKIKQDAISYARAKYGATRKPIEINDKEWEAIQSGAVTDTVLSKILINSDADKLRERATPRNFNELTPAKRTRLNALKASGYTNSEIAEALGVSVSAISKYM